MKKNEENLLRNNYLLSKGCQNFFIPEIMTCFSITWQRKLPLFQNMAFGKEFGEHCEKRD
jgi:hypothetical protein